METGKKNLQFGWTWLLLFIILGFYLLLRVADPDWGGLQRAFWRTAHIHGNLLSFLNIFYGLIIDKTGLSGWLKESGSWLAIIGVILFTGSLFLSPFVPNLRPVELVGGIAVIISVAIMAYGQVFARAS